MGKKKDINNNKTNKDIETIKGAIKDNNIILQRTNSKENSNRHDKNKTEKKKEN